jgi:uncharacterized glyoxalase superfamily protein PhnB
MESRNSHNIRTVPDNLTSITPWIISASTSEMIEFLTTAFGAREVPDSRVRNEEGVIIHAVVKLGTATIMLFDSREGWGPTPAFLNLYVPDVEQAYKRALELGATSVTDITPLYFGEKVCRILDPFGNLWWLNERIEELEPAEIKLRAGTGEAARGIAYIQQSLDEALKAQKAFFQLD